jgi:hypothetical protein
MNNPDQHEIDDELLSAYLDDELSPAERSLVEDRLAADPAARLTLEHLRSVSQSVRDLPTETIGRDLRDSILQRATASRAVLGPDCDAPRNQPSPLSKTTCKPPAISIGRTTRGWVWASAAVAAALLIMVLQPNEERRAGLPHVAQKSEPRTEIPAPLNRQLAENRETLSAVDGESMSVSDALESPMPAAPSSGQAHPVDSDRARIAAAPSAAPATTSGQLDPGRVAVQFPEEAAHDMPLAAAPPAAEHPTGGATAAASQPVVVRVLARRTAVENNVFETLLQKNGVVVVPTTNGSNNELAAAVGRPEPTSAREQAPADAPSDSNTESKTNEEQILPPKQKVTADDSVELVLVDAPPSTIFSCMDALNSDADNYLGISVDDPSLSEKKQVAAKANENKPASDLVRFNRGPIPQSQESVAEVSRYYDYFGSDVARRQSQQRSFDKSGSSSEARGFELKELEQRASGDESGAGRGRALRLPLRALDKTEESNTLTDLPEYGAQSTADAKFRHRWGVPLAAPATPDSDRMQVLFVIRPTDEPPPSLKAKNQAE